MPEIAVNKLKLVGTGYAEMPQDGRRYRFKVERYLHDDGTEYGKIVEMTEIPDVGPYLWVPSYGVEAAEAEYLSEEFEHEKANPHPKDIEWWGEHRQKARQLKESYDEAREERARHVTRRLRG